MQRKGIQSQEIASGDPAAYDDTHLRCISWIPIRWAADSEGAAFQGGFMVSGLIFDTHPRQRVLE